MDWQSLFVSPRQFLTHLGRNLGRKISSSCSLYFRGDAIWVFPNADSDGATVMIGPGQKLDREARPEQIGDAIISATSKPRVIKLTPGHELPAKNAVKEAGFKSISALERGAALLSAHREADEMSIQAWAASGAGYVPAANGERTCPVDATAIGNLMLELLPLCAPRGQPKIVKSSGPTPPQVASEPDPDDLPISFGYKIAWIAVPSDDGRAVADALGLHQIKRSSWESGIARAHESKGIFVTPPVEGWTLAAGSLPEAGDDALLGLLENLSRQFGQAFYFASHRVVEYQAWARADHSVIQRAFAWIGESGEFPLNIGSRTPEEIELNTGVEELENAPDEETVLAIAAKWVLDPRQLDQTDANGPGWFGKPR